MKIYKSSALTQQRSVVLKEARENGVIIQECNTNGDVRCEYVIVDKPLFDDMNKICDVYEGGI